MEPATGLEQFFDAAERLVADHGANPATFARIGNLLRIVAADGTLIDESRLDALHQSSAQATILGHGPTDRHILWRRQDDGSRVGQAQLQIIETRELAPGDVAWFPDVPADIHSQQGIGEAAWELVYFGRDPNARPRLYFEPDTGRVEERAAVQRSA